MNKVELKNKNKEELQKLLQELKDNLLSLRVKVELSQYKKVREIRENKKQVARILTLLKEQK